MDTKRMVLPVVVSVLALGAVIGVIRLRILMDKTDAAEKAETFSILRGGVSWEHEKPTQESVYTVEKCVPTPDDGLYNCFVLGKEPFGGRFSTHAFAPGTKVVLVTFHRQSDANEVYLLERLSSYDATALGISLSHCADGKAPTDHHCDDGSVPAQ